MNRLREALTDNPDEPRYIQTLPRKGYRFIAPVTPEKRDEPRKAGGRRWPLWAAGGCLAAAAAAMLGWWVLVPTRITSLAVLPMANLSQSADEEYLADGMTEAVIASLAQVKSLEKVISRTSVMQFKGTKTPAPEIARKLGVKGIVEGTVQRHGERVRVTVQLIDATRDRHIWSRSYDRDLRDVLMLQNEIATSIADEVQAALAPEERTRLAAERTVNPKAYRLYARGRRLCDLWTTDGIRRGIALLEQAVAVDPQFAEAHAACAECLTYLVTWGVERPRDGWPRVRRHVERALELNPESPDALAVLGTTKLQFDWDWEGAGNHVDRAVETGPSNGLARMLRVVYLTAMGRHEEALADAARAEDLAPGSSTGASYLAWASAKARKYDAAAARWRELLAMDPHAYYARTQLVFSLTRLGKVAEANDVYAPLRESMRAGTELVGDCWVMEYEVAAGLRDQALKTALYWTSERDRGYVSGWNLAWMYSVLGRKDEAMKWLETGYDERGAEMYMLKVDPTMDALRGDPRFQALVKRMGFPK